MRYVVATVLGVLGSASSAQTGCLTSQLDMGPVENLRLEYGQIKFEVDVVSKFEVPLTGLAFGARVLHRDRPFPIAAFWFGDATISGALMPGETLQITATHHLDDRGEHFASDPALLEVEYWILNATDLDRHPAYLDSYTMSAWDTSDRSPLCRPE